MSRLIAALVLAIVITGVCITGNTYINKVIDKSNILIDECITNYESHNNPENKATELKKYWSKNEGLLSIFAHHKNIDDIELAIDSLLTYSNTNENQIFYEYSGTVKTLLHQLSEDNSLNMHSVF